MTVSDSSNYIGVIQQFNRIRLLIHELREWAPAAVCVVLKTRGILHVNLLKEVKCRVEFADA